MSISWKYRRIEQVGQGSCGVVFRAKRRISGRIVALKELAHGADEDQRRRLAREAEVLATLDHPSIVRLLGIEGSSERLALIMEYVDGATLAQLLRSGPLPLRAAVFVARSVLEALDYAHTHGVVHRDVSPRNVLVGRDGSVKLADFGIARLAGRTRTANPSAGTVPYMAPEQILGADVDGRADLFAAGALLFALVTGEPLFTGSTAHEMEARILSGRSDAANRLPPALSPIVARLVARERDARFATAADALAALPDVEAGRDELGALVAVRVPAPTRPHRWSRWWLTPVGAAAALIGWQQFDSRGAATSTPTTVPAVSSPTVGMGEIVAPIGPSSRLEFTRENDTDPAPVTDAPEKQRVEVAGLPSPQPRKAATRKRKRKRRAKPPPVAPAKTPAKVPAKRMEPARPDWSMSWAHREPWARTGRGERLDNPKKGEQQ